MIRLVSENARLRRRLAQIVSQNQNIVNRETRRAFGWEIRNSQKAESPAGKAALARAAPSP